jgi:lysozyme family protein
LHEYSRSFKDAFDHIIKIEGTKFTNHPDDRGGPTKFGITLLVLREFRQNKLLGADDIKALKIFEAMEIYKVMFWDLLSLDKVEDPRIGLVIFDYAVNSGPVRAIELVQVSINKAAPWLRKVPEDGVMGAGTLAALNRIDRVVFGFQFFKELQARYIAIAIKNPTQMVFLHGWFNRTYKVLENIL